MHGSINPSLVVVLERAVYNGHVDIAYRIQVGFTNPTLQYTLL